MTYNVLLGTLHRVRKDRRKSWNLKVTFSRPGNCWSRAWVMENQAEPWKCV